MLLLLLLLLYVVDVQLRKEIDKCHPYTLSDLPMRDIDISPEESEVDTADISLLGQKLQQKQRALKRKKFALRWASWVGFVGTVMMMLVFMPRWMTQPFMPGSIVTVTWDLLLVFVTILIAWIYTYQVMQGRHPQATAP